MGDLGWSIRIIQGRNFVTREKLAIELTEEEVGLLTAAIWQWGGPATPTLLWAWALGSWNVRAFHKTCRRLRVAVERRDPLSRRDWLRALASTEVVFISDEVGAGSEWETVTGMDDADTVACIRGLQQKILDAVYL